MQHFAVYPGARRTVRLKMRAQLLTDRHNPPPFAQRVQALFSEPSIWANRLKKGYLPCHFRSSTQPVTPRKQSKPPSNRTSIEDREAEHHEAASPSRRVSFSSHSRIASPFPACFPHSTRFFALSLCFECVTDGACLASKVTHSTQRNFQVSRGCLFANTPKRGLWESSNHKVRM